MIEREGASPEQQAAIDALLKDWADKIAKYDSEPESGAGRKEWIARAKAAEADRDKALAASNDFGYASAALQLAIVLASASTHPRDRVACLCRWRARGFRTPYCRCKI